MDAKNVNPAPVTPPPPVPGTRNAKEYYELICDYNGVAINIKDFPPHKNETISEYRQRLVNMCNSQR